MSRLTPNEVTDLIEAYSAVYTPQELTEEQIWEEVENWVNSLVEEGYDLSEYTWEEMYESYLEEKEGIFNNDITRGIGNYARSLFSNPQNKTAANSGQFGRYIPGSQQVKTPAPAARPAAAAPAARPAAAAPAARPAAAAPAARPAAAAPAVPKVSPSTPAKPAGPAMGKLGGTTFERRTPTSAELKAAQAARASGASPEKALQAAKSAGGALSQATAAASKPAAFDSSSSSTAAAKTSPTPKLTPRQQRLNMEMEYDTYDVVLEYLLSQGHVETVAEAHYVMMEMNAEMIQNILEETTTQRLARRASEKANEPGAKSDYKPQGPGLRNPRSRASILNQIAGRARTRDERGVDSQYGEGTSQHSEQPRRGGRRGRGSQTDRPGTANMPNPNRKPKQR